MAQLKLISSKGTYLGVLTVPNTIADMMSRNTIAQAPMYDPVMMRASWAKIAAAELPAIDIRTVTFQRDYSTPDGVRMYGMTPEEIETWPGYSFAPSAAYLRSLVTEGEK